MTDYRQQGLVVEAHESFVDVWRATGRPVSPQVAEDVGEDHGFYSPVSTEITGGGRRVAEGFTGELCSHKWGMTGHFGRNPYGTFSTCESCGVHIRVECRRGSDKATCVYDVWELRPHIYNAWRKRGPVPGSLQAEAHHQGGA